MVKIDIRWKDQIREVVEMIMIENECPDEEHLDYLMMDIEGLIQDKLRSLELVPSPFKEKG